VMWTTIDICCKSFDRRYVHCNSFCCRCTPWMKYPVWCQFSILNLMGMICIRNPLHINQYCTRNWLGKWNQAVMWTTVGICCRSFDCYSIRCSNFHCNCMHLMKYHLWYQLLIANLRDKICIRNPLHTNRCCIRNVLGMWNRLEPWTRLDIWYMSFDPR
jgi:hypothetical protein